MDNSNTFRQNPEKIDWKADADTLDALGQLCNTRLRAALTSTLRAHVTGDGIHLRFEKIAFVVSDGLITVDFPDWANTEFFALSAFLLRARHVKTAPDWAEKAYSAKKRGPVHPWTGMSFVSPDFSKQPTHASVNRVIVYRCTRERHHVVRNFTERVAFDKAVLLEMKPGHPSTLLFVDDSNIAGLLGLSTNPEEIAEILEDCEVSKEINIT